MNEINDSKRMYQPRLCSFLNESKKKIAIQQLAIICPTGGAGLEAVFHGARLAIRVAYSSDGHKSDEVVPTTNTLGFFFHKKISF